MEPKRVKGVVLQGKLAGGELHRRGTKQVLLKRLKEAPAHEEEVAMDDWEEEDEALAVEVKAEATDEEEVAKRKPESTVKKAQTNPPQKKPEPGVSGKAEAEDTAKLGDEGAAMEKWANESVASHGVDVDVKVKEECIDIKEEPVEGQQEASETVRQREKRASSHSCYPHAEKQQPKVEEVRVKDEPEGDQTALGLDLYNSDLSLTISKEDFVSAQPLTMKGFGFVWHGVRATHGFTRGSVFFEVKIEDYLPVPHVEEEEQHPHVVRVGWSVSDAGLTLGEDPFSYGYEGTGNASTDMKLKDYGRPFGKGDIVGCFLDLEYEPVVMSFTVNGQHQGIAYQVPHYDLGDQALFPHIATKNTSFRANFASEPAWMEPLCGYTFIGKIPQEDRVLGTQAPETKEDVEVRALRFYHQTNMRPQWVAPHTGADSDLEVEDDTRDDDEDPLVPEVTGVRTLVQPQDLPDEVESEEEEEEEEDEAQPRKRARITRHRLWKKEDIKHPPFKAFILPGPGCLRSPFQYFQDMFPVSLLEDIMYQTKLHACQKDINTKFTTDKCELMVFIGIILYMGVTRLPDIDDYWDAQTRVPQVADVMSAKRFKLIRSLLHFNNNMHAASSKDKFYKIRPIYSSITKQFLKVATSPAQAVYEVMVPYKDTRAGDSGHHTQTKPVTWGFKLFCRASVDGFIHDIIMYQGDPTFPCHHTTLSEEEFHLYISSKIVIALVKTLQNPRQSIIYANNLFTSIGLIEYLREHYGCRYVGMARVHRLGNPSLMSFRDMNQESVPRGTSNYCSADGILALHWKDSKIVTVLSSHEGVKPIKTVLRYDKQAKTKIKVPCPCVIKNYNGMMAGINKSDMLTSLYRTPVRAKRWYIKLFGYALDVCVYNAWLLYKRDSKSLGDEPTTLKNFRLDVSRAARRQKVSEGHVIKGRRAKRRLESITIT